MRGEKGRGGGRQVQYSHSSAAELSLQKASGYPTYSTRYLPCINCLQAMGGDDECA